MRLGLASNALDGGDVGPVAGAEKHSAGGDRPVEELLLRWIPGGHDDIAGSGVTKGAVVLGSFEADDISDKRNQGARGISVGGVDRFTWKIVVQTIKQKSFPTIHKEKNRRAAHSDVFPSRRFTNNCWKVGPSSGMWQPG